MIKECTCKNDYQDAMYGKGYRVFNPAAANNRCTVCGKKDK